MFDEAVISPAAGEGAIGLSAGLWITFVAQNQLKKAGAPIGVDPPPRIASFLQVSLVFLPIDLRSAICSLQRDVDHSTGHSFRILVGRKSGADGSQI